MRKRAVVASVLSSLAVLVFGWQMGTQAIGVSTLATGTLTTTPVTTTPVTTTPATSTPATSTPATAGVAGTFTGSAASTRYGTVQVSITVAGGSITDVTALKLTDADRKSVQISSRAAPVLRQSVLAAQSAKVSVVSGATYTSDGYLQSLQSALDQAGL